MVSNIVRYIYLPTKSRSHFRLFLLSKFEVIELRTADGMFASGLRSSCCDSFDFCILYMHIEVELQVVDTYNKWSKSQTDVSRVFQQEKFGSFV